MKLCQSWWPCSRTSASSRHLTTTTSSSRASVSWPNQNPKSGSTSKVGTNKIFIFTIWLFWAYYFCHFSVKNRFEVSTNFLTIYWLQKQFVFVISSFLHVFYFLFFNLWKIKYQTIKSFLTLCFNALMYHFWFSLPSASISKMVSRGQYRSY